MAAIPSTQTSHSTGGPAAFPAEEISPQLLQDSTKLFAAMTARTSSPSEDEAARVYLLGQQIFKLQCRGKYLKNSASMLLQNVGVYYAGTGSDPGTDFGVNVALEYQVVRTYRIFLNILWVQILRSQLTTPEDGVKTQYTRVKEKIRKKLSTIPGPSLDGSPFIKAGLIHELNSIRAISKHLFSSVSRAETIAKNVKAIQKMFKDFKDQHGSQIQAASRVTTISLAIGGLFCPPLLLAAGSLQITNKIYQKLNSINPNLPNELEEFGEEVFDEAKELFRFWNKGKEIKTFLDNWNLGCSAFRLEKLEEIQESIFEKIGEFSKESEHHAMGSVETLANMIELSKDEDKEIRSLALLGDTHDGLLQFAFHRNPGVRELTAFYLDQLMGKKRFSKTEKKLSKCAIEFVSNTDSEERANYKNGRNLLKHLHVSLIDMEGITSDLNHTVAMDKKGVKAQFLHAAEYGIPELMRQIVNDESNQEMINKHGGQALYKACRGNHSKCVDLLLRAGSSTRNMTNGLLPIHIAARRDAVESVRLLLEKDPETFGIESKKGYTALYLASYHGCTNSLKYLLEKRKELGIHLNDGAYLLFRAAERNHPEAVALLLGEEVSQDVYYRGELPIHRAASLSDTKCAEILIKNMPRTNRRSFVNTQSISTTPTTPLHIAVTRDRTEMAKMLCSYGADPNTTGPRKNTALHIVCQNGNLELLKTIINQCVDLDRQNDNKETPLYLAARNGHAACLEFLLKNRADASKARNGGWVPLHSAAKNGNQDCIDLLLGAVKDINVLSGKKETPLYLACRGGHVGSVRKLLDAGADPSIPQKDGISPLKIAAKRGHTECVELLSRK